ncbi:hypothetical protein D3C81_2104140 [compost metagenome]
MGACQAWATYGRRASHGLIVDCLVWHTGLYLVGETTQLKGRSRHFTVESPGTQAGFFVGQCHKSGLVLFKTAGQST